MLAPTEDGPSPAELDRWPYPAIERWLRTASEAQLRAARCDALTETAIRLRLAATPAQLAWLRRQFGRWALASGVAVGRIAEQSDGTWQALPPGPAGERDGMAAVILPVWGGDRSGPAGWQASDLVAWPVDDPAAARSATGATAILGAAELLWAGSAGGAVAVAADAADWLRRGGDLVLRDIEAPPLIAVLDWTSEAAAALFRTTATFVVASEAEAQALYARQEAWRRRHRPPKARILIDRPEEKAA